MSVLEVPSLVDAVQHAMRMRILDGAVTPGSVVTEQMVATEFSVARTTAKAAVERLVHDGLLRRTANKSARVPVLAVAEIRDVYASRELVEGAVMERLAPRRTVPAGALDALRRFDEALAQGATSAVVESDIAFHRALVDALGSDRISRVYQSLMGEAQLCMAQVQYLKLLDPHLIAAEHRAIVTAVQGGVPADARAALETHLGNASTRILAALASTG